MHPDCITQKYVFSYASWCLLSCPHQAVLCPPDMFNLLLLACLHLYLLACLHRSINKNVFTYRASERAKVRWSWTFNIHLSLVCRRLVLLLNFWYRLSCLAPIRASQTLASISILCLFKLSCPLLHLLEPCDVQKMGDGKLRCATGLCTAVTEWTCKWDPGTFSPIHFKITQQRGLYILLPF